MNDSHYLYSIKMQGWATTTGTYSSDIKDAQLLERSEAIDKARKHCDQGRLTLVPVSAATILEVRQ
jgi:hypothetical protein